MSHVDYFVRNDNTLCYQRAGEAFYGVLAGSVIRGGLDPLSGMHMRLDSDKIRPATLQDFADYRVMVPKGFVEPVGAPPPASRPPLAVRRFYDFPNARLVVYVGGMCREFPKWSPSISVQRSRQWTADALRQLRKWRAAQATPAAA